MAKKRDAAEMVLKVDGGHEAFAVKLRSFLEAEDAEITRKRNKVKGWAKFLIFGGLLSIASGIGLNAVNWPSLPPALLDMAPILIVPGILGIVVGVLVWALFLPEGDEVARGKTLQGALDKLRADFHARTPVKGRLDFGEVTETKHERSATSPYSGAQKLYYRHEWLALRWGFADGNLLALTITDLVKTKSGGELRREHQLRGHMRLNTALYELRDRKQFRCDYLTVLPVEKNGEVHVYFWGRLPKLDELFTALETVYGRFKPRKRSSQAMA